MNNVLTPKERKYLGRVKELPCSVCGSPGPSEAHHTKQGNAYTCIALCEDCHRGSRNGWHGQKFIWNVMKMDENDALNKTLRALQG
jgi:hypothetical protein